MTLPNYDESSIRSLKGLEAVRERPGMFTRLDSPLHMVQEVIDNAVDEALAGYAKELRIRLLPDDVIEVMDNGRGIPVGNLVGEQVPVIEAVFTRLHTGGKFDKKRGGAYKISGGLHGVGVTVTNALSDFLVAEVVRDGKKHRIEFRDGEVVKPLKLIERGVSGSGTVVRFKPTGRFFDSPEVPVNALKALCKSKAVLMPGFPVYFENLRTDPPTEELFNYAQGKLDFLNEISPADPLVPVLSDEAFATETAEGMSEGEGASWALSWYESGHAEGASFVNLVPTPQHGTHVSGLRSALFNGLRDFIDHHAMLPKGIKLTADDVFKQVHFVFSAILNDPSFDNQTKDRLNSRDAVKLIEKLVQPKIEAWLNHNPVYAKAVAELCIRNASARQRAAQKVERKKTSSVVMLPGKLADCESDDPAITELFLVEGDSAGGSAKMARNKENQAILPMRGKSLNAWEKLSSEALENAEVHDISVAIGILPHSEKDTVDFSKIRYGKLCILSDADVDGFHIQTLLLTLFYKHFPQLIRKGHVFVSQTPLYRIDVDAAGKKKPAKKIYVMDQAELTQQIERLKREGYSSFRTSRFKGLGEMNPDELAETALHPDTRRLSQVVIDSDFETQTHEVLDMLMNRSRASHRRSWLEDKGDLARD